MKKKIIIGILSLIAIGCFYSFGPADEQDWQMKQYYFVMLTKGPNRSQDSLTSAKIQEGHLANLGKLEKEGKLHISGPFGDNGNWRGILILDVKTQQEAEALVKADPAVIAGRLSYEIHPWWGGVGSKLK